MPDPASPTRTVDAGPSMRAAAAAAPARSIPALLDANALRLGGRTAARVRGEAGWQAISWADLARRVRDVAGGLAALGVAPGDRVGLLADTSHDALVVDLGIAAAAAVSVPIYASSTPRECEHALRTTGARLVVCDREEQVRKIDDVRRRLPALGGVVAMARARGGGSDRTLAEVEALGRGARHGSDDAHAARVAALGPDDEACILFTSGTTGDAKGVVLTHGNWLYAAQAPLVLGLLADSDSCLLFLPLAHAFAKLCEVGWLVTGAELSCTPIDRIAEAAAELRPTFIPGPPRVWEKILAGVVQQGSAAPGLRGLLFRAAMAAFDRAGAATERGERAGGPGLWLARRLVLPRAGREVSGRLGGRIRILLSGAAPLSPRVGRFFEALGFTLLEGYGMTETSAASCVTRPGRIRWGTVGFPFPGTDVRIAGDGEVLLRSPGLMRGYLGDPDATAEVLREGWMHTGDLGTLDPDGALRITGRKKDLIVTAGGKKVAPQLVERELAADPLVAQVLVHGDRRPYLTALVALDPDAVRRWADAEGLELAEPPREDPRVRARIERTVAAVNAALPRYAQVKRFAILPSELTAEAGELTPTGKVRRAACERRHAALLDGLYPA